MQQKKNKKWKLIGTILVAVVAVVMLVSAVARNNAKVCSGIAVEINSPSNNFFVSEREVKQMINEEETVTGLPKERVNLHKLEARLRKDKWIEAADLFFDKDHVLQVRVEENEPIARIFTATGNSFYIDSACRKLPLSKTLSARVPMFTNFPSDNTKLSKPDSAVLASVKELAIYILSDDFWKAQVAQIDITPNGFEMVPTIGNHTVSLGKSGEWKQKFDRLFTFYKQVWVKVGLNAYEKIDVQYAGQVIAMKKGASTFTNDTAGVRLVLQNLLATANSKQEENIKVDTDAKSVAATKAVNKKIGSDIQKASNGNEASGVNATVNIKVVNKQVPKAIMGKMIDR